MTTTRTAAEVLDGLLAQAHCLWGEDEAARQRPGLQQTAEQIVTMDAYTLPPDLEPRFF